MSWREDLKVGDLVAVQPSTGSMYADKVSRITPTLIMTGDKFDKYVKRSGRSYGSSVWSGSFLLEPTDEVISKIKRTRLERKVKSVLATVDVSKMASDKLVEINEFITRLLQSENK
jgi:hypothetical protein